MKKQLHFLTLILFLGFVNSVLAQGITTFRNFSEGDGLGNWAISSGGTYTITSGHLNVTCTQVSPKYRADLQYNNGSDVAKDFSLNPANETILAIKFIGDRPDAGTGRLKLEMQRVPDPIGAPGTTVWDNSASNWQGGQPANETTVNGNKIYYFDLTADPDYTGTSDLTYRRLNLIIADAPTTNTYSVDWIATFADLTDLQNNVNMMDDGGSDSDEVALGVDDIIIKNNVFKLYPNPSTNNSFSIEFGKGYNNSVSSVKIYSILGSLVLDKAINANTNKITINHNLKSGVYIVKLDDSTSKLIVK